MQSNSYIRIGVNVEVLVEAGRNIGLAQLSKIAC